MRGEGEGAIHRAAADMPWARGFLPGSARGRSGPQMRGSKDGINDY